MKQKRQSLLSLLAACILGGAVLLTMVLITAPAPQPASAPSTEFSNPGSVHFLLVEEKTGLPSFPALATQPQPGTMPSPGEFYQGVPTDFTAIYSDFMVEENHGREVP